MYWKEIVISLKWFELEKSALHFNEFPISALQGNLEIKLYFPSSAIYSLSENTVHIDASCRVIIYDQYSTLIVYWLLLGGTDLSIGLQF